MLRAIGYIFLLTASVGNLRSKNGSGGVIHSGHDSPAVVERVNGDEIMSLVMSVDVKLDGLVDAALGSGVTSFLSLPWSSCAVSATYDRPQRAHE